MHSLVTSTNAKYLQFRNLRSKFTLPFCFSLNNSETVKTVTLAFCSNQRNFVRDICIRFDVLNWAQYLDNGQNLDRGIFDFRISGQSLIKENCCNSKTSNNIDMKVRPVTKIDKKNMTVSKRIDDGVMSTNCDVNVSFSIYGQFGAIRKPGSG